MANHAACFSKTMFDNIYSSHSSVMASQFRLHKANCALYKHHGIARWVLPLYQTLYRVRKYLIISNRRGYLPFDLFGAAKQHNCSNIEMVSPCYHNLHGTKLCTVLLVLDILSNLLVNVY